MLRSIGKHSRESVESVLKKQEAQLSPRDRAMRRGVEILPIATQQCSTTSPGQIEVMKLEG